MNAVFNWSGGKDSALALYKVLQAGDLQVTCLLTTVNETFNRISMHGVRTELLERQAESIGIPLLKVMLPEMPDMQTYERIMEQQLRRLKADGIEAAVFGDIFLEDLRKYREENLAAIGVRCRFPIWKISTSQLVLEFIELGFRAITVCVDEKHLDRSFVGRELDESFLQDLPPDVDPCGENGEFHSFVYDGPIFQKPLDFRTGEVVHRKYSRQKQGTGDMPSADSEDPFETGFWFCDLLPVGA